MKNGKKLLRLKGERIMADLTQKDMGELINKDESTYRKKENGEVDFRLSEMLIISKRLKLSADTLFR